ncbi:hypothetical protein DYH52_15030 [Morganella morganii]|nr:hypothetical protein DYH52_15030 [Morganella morganii]
MAALAALRNPGHILVYAPRISSFAALPQIEIYSVKALAPERVCQAFSSRIFRVFFTFFSMRWRFSGER